MGLEKVSIRGRLRRSSTFMIVISILILPSVFYFEGKNSIDVSLEDAPRRAVPDFSTYAWSFPWDPDAFDALKRWGNDLDEISPYWYWATGNGSVVRTHAMSEDIETVKFCRQEGIRIVPMVSNNHDPGIVANITRKPSVQARHIGELLNLTLKFNYEGLDINYESIRTEERIVYSNFIRNLSGALHSRGKLLYVSVFPKVASWEQREGPDAYDYRNLSLSADGLRIMAYNLHWSSAETAGPITSYEWIDRVLGYSITEVPSQKLILGMPLFGYDWPVNKQGRTLGVAKNTSYAEIEAIKREYNLERKWNSTSRTPYFEYRHRDGNLHSLHYCDAESLLHEMVLVDKYGLNGICIWKIGGEDPNSPFFIRSVRSSGLEDLPPYIDIGKDIMGMVGQKLNMGPVRAYDIDGIITGIMWEFGDGSTSNLLEPQHGYGSGGFYTSTLHLRDDGGNTISLSKQVKIGPFAKYSITGQPEVGRSLTFDATESWDPYGIISYSWDMGDGTFFFHDEPVVEHTYNGPGTFKIVLTIIDSKGYSDNYRTSLAVPDLERPLAVGGGDITVWEDSYITLDGRGSYDNSGMLNYTWTISSGAVMYGPVCRFFVVDPFDLEAMLKVTDSSGLYDEDQIMIRVRDRTPPVLVLDHPTEAKIGDLLIFDASKSHDNSGAIFYKWSFSEGDTITGQDQVSLRVSEARTYYITLDIMDGEGNWNSSTISVKVKDSNPPNGKVIIVPEPRDLSETYLYNDSYALGLAKDESFSGVLLQNLTYIFMAGDLTDDVGIAIINWTFGDGSGAGGPLVYHSYQRSGLYRGKLRISDIHGNLFEEGFVLLVLTTFNMTERKVQGEKEVFINETTYVQPEERNEENNVPLMALIVVCAFLIASIVLTDMVLITIKRMKRGGRCP